MKPCTKCKTVKAADQFRADPRYRSGRASWCKVCKAESTRRSRQASRPVDRIDRRRYRGLLGEKSPLHKITEAQVRELRASREPSATVARRLGVAASTVRAARNRTTWSHL